MAKAKGSVPWAALIASLAILVALTYVACQPLLDQGPKYNDGAKFLDSVADELGRTSQNQISSRHLKSSWGELYPYDYIEIVFSTDKTPAQLASDLQRLESTLNGKGVFYQDYLSGVANILPIQTLQATGLSLSLDSLSFKQGVDIHKEDLPITTSWAYKTKTALVAMEIVLMEPNTKGDKWRYQDRIINGNIVVLTLYLSKF